MFGVLWQKGQEPKPRQLSDWPRSAGPDGSGPQTLASPPSEPAAPSPAGSRPQISAPLRRMLPVAPGFAQLRAMSTFGRLLAGLQAYLSDPLGVLHTESGPPCARLTYVVAQLGGVVALAGTAERPPAAGDDAAASAARRQGILRRCREVFATAVAGGEVLSGVPGGVQVGKRGGVMALCRVVWVRVGGLLLPGELEWWSTPAATSGGATSVGEQSWCISAPTDSDNEVLARRRLSTTHSYVCI